MSFPLPQPGLVIRYAYLWKREAAAGGEEGVKDRPCALVVAFKDAEEKTQVFVLPITHNAPQAPDSGIEIPRRVKEYLGLDFQRSWVIINEANLFAWPGPDLRPAPGQGPESIAYGLLPPRFFRIVRDAHLALARERRVSVVVRSE